MQDIKVLAVEEGFIFIDLHQLKSKTKVKS